MQLIEWSPALEGRTVSKSETREQFVVDSAGRKTAVVVPIKEYEQLLEDIHDLAVVAERRGERSISLEAMKKRLQRK